MWTVLLPIIGELVLEGVQAWSEERRTRFMDEHHTILSKIARLKAIPVDSPRYTDSAIAVSEKQLVTFLTAYQRELKLEKSNT